MDGRPDSDAEAGDGAGLPGDGDAALETDAFAALMAATHDAVWVTDNTGVITDVNDRLVRFLGYPREQLIGRHVREFAAVPDVLERRALARRHGGARFESQIRRADGTLLHVDVSLSYLPRAGGQFIVFLRDDTARKQAEKSLRESEARFRLIVDDLPQIVAYVDSDLTCRFVNRTYLKLYAARAEDVVGRPLREVLGEPAFATAWPYLQRVLNGETVRYHQRHAYAAGPARDIDGVMIPSFTPEGEVCGYYAVLTDITIYMAAQVKLCEAVERMEVAARAGNVGLWEWDPQTKEVYLADQWKRQLGYEPDELPDRYAEWEERVHPNDLPGTLQYIQSVLTGTGDSYCIEFRMRHRDGRYRWMLSQAYVSRDAAGRAVRVLGTHVDITQHRTAENTLRRLSTVIEQSPNAVIVTDVNGNIEYVNPAFERLTGYAQAEVLGRNPRLLKSGQHDGAFYRDLWDTLLAGAVWEGRLLDRRKNGSLYTVQAMIAPVRGADGQICNFVASSRDITEQLTLEEQLRQAQKLDAIGQLAGGVAHDFNNILTAILGNAELAAATVADGAYTKELLGEALTQIQKGGERAAALTRQLLAFSRRQANQPRVFDLNDVLHDLERMLRRLLTENITLRLDLASHLWPLHADPAQVEQVVVNLAVNARDAMHTGGTLSIHTRNVALDSTQRTVAGEVAAGRYVVLTVADTGCGMDDATLARIFEPFFTTKSLGRGTGLGLSTVYGVVRQAEGHIGVQSAVGQGTTFTLYLRAADMSPTQEEECPIQPREVGRHETILLCEDDEAVRSLAGRALRDAGYRVLAASCGAEALQIALEDSGPLELLVTDVIMTDTNGRELAHRLTDMLGEVPTLYISGYTADIIAVHGVLDEGVQFLAKPFTADQLVRRVQAVLAAGAEPGRGARRDDFA